MSLVQIITLLSLILTKTNGYGTNGCQEIDDLLADVWRIGDSNRLWPEHDTSLQQYCLNSIENNDKIINFFDTVFPDNYHIQILVRLISVERTRLLMKNCKNKQNRARALVLARALNRNVGKLEKIRQDAVNRLIAIGEEGSTATFKDMIQVIKNYDDQSVKALTTKPEQDRLRQFAESNRRLTNFYLQNVELVKQKRRDKNPCPKEWRPNSFQYAEAMAFNRIFSDLDHDPELNNQPE